MMNIVFLYLQTWSIVTPPPPVKNVLSDDNSLFMSYLLAKSVRQDRNWLTTLLEQYASTESENIIREEHIALCGTKQRLPALFLIISLKK